MAHSFNIKEKVLFTPIRSRRTGVYVHDVGCNSTARGDEHYSALNYEVLIDETFDCQVHQHASHQPDCEDRQESTKDL